MLTYGRFKTSDRSQ